MKRLPLLVVMLFVLSSLFALPSFAGQHKSSSDVKVRSYRTKRGTRVQSHMRSRADHTKSNNFSTRGNRNPYTGKKGYKSASSSTRSHRSSRSSSSGRSHRSRR